MASAKEPERPPPFPHTLKAKTSASLFFQLHLFIEYFISLLISLSGNGLCDDLRLLSCKVFTAPRPPNELKKTVEHKKIGSGENL